MSSFGDLLCIIIFSKTLKQLISLNLVINKVTQIKTHYNYSNYNLLSNNLRCLEHTLKRVVSALNA